MRAKIVPLLPLGRTYVEPYGGAASIMCARRPAPVEVYNDLDGDLVNLFRVMQDKDAFAELRDRLRATPYARDEFRLALETLRRDDASNVERAWAFFVAQNQGTSGIPPKGVGEWSRAIATSCKGMAATCSRWASRVAHIPVWRRRFLNVQIDSRDALKVIENYDSLNTVFYLDPPYAPETREKGSTKVYAAEASHKHHENLVAVLLNISGAVALSGYDTCTYAPLDYAGWHRTEWHEPCGVKPGTHPRNRTEVLWRNHMCLEMLATEHTKRVT